MRSPLNRISKSCLISEYPYLKTYVKQVYEWENFYKFDSEDNSRVLFNLPIKGRYIEFLVDIKTKKIMNISITPRGCAFSAYYSVGNTFINMITHFCYCGLSYDIITASFVTVGAAKHEGKIKIANKIRIWKDSNMDKYIKVMYLKTRLLKLI